MEHRVCVLGGQRVWQEVLGVYISMYVFVRLHPSDWEGQLLTAQYR